MDIKHNFKIGATTNKIYDAITTQQGINGWWAKDADVMRKPREVSKMRFAKDSGPIEMQFRIDRLEPPTKVVWTCVNNLNPAWIGTQLSFELKDMGTESDFTFIHGNWDTKWKGQLPYEQTKEGWQHFMNSIKEYCETGKGQPW